MIASVRQGRNIRAVEAAAYAAVLLGQVQVARGFLAAARAPQDGPPWVTEVAERMRTVDELLDANEIQAATELLASWEQRTVAALKVSVA